MLFSKQNPEPVMTDHRKDSSPNRMMPWIVAAVVIALIGLVIYFVGRNQTDDNLVPTATAVDPRSGSLTATGVAAEGVEGQAAPPPVGGVAPGASGAATFSDGGAGSTPAAQSDPAESAPTTGAAYGADSPDAGRARN